MTTTTTIKAVVNNSGYQWLWVGEVTIDGGWVHIGRAVNVRRYTGGISSLCGDPSKCTIDAAFSGLSQPIGASIQLIDVDQEAWGAVLERHHPCAE